MQGSCRRLSHIQQNATTVSDLLVLFSATCPIFSLLLGAKYKRYYCNVQSTINTRTHTHTVSCEHVCIHTGGRKLTWGASIWDCEKSHWNSWAKGQDYPFLTDELIQLQILAFSIVIDYSSMVCMSAKRAVAERAEWIQDYGSQRIAYGHPFNYYWSLVLSIYIAKAQPSRSYEHYRFMIQSQVVCTTDLCPKV